MKGTQLGKIQGERMRRIQRGPCLVLLGSALAAPPGSSSGQDGAPQIDPRADRILEQSGAYLAQAGGFTFHAETTVDDPLPSGVLVQLGVRLDVAVRRPDRIRADFSGDRRARSFYYDGSTFTLLHRDQDLYATERAAQTIDAALDQALDRFGVTLPLSDLAYADPYATLIASVESGTYVGRHEVDGIPCHHLAFTQETIDWEIWIEDGIQIVPRKLHVVYKREPGQPRYTARLSRWSFPETLPDALFSFSPPPGAEEIELIPADGEGATP